MFVQRSRAVHNLLFRETLKSDESEIISVLYENDLQFLQHNHLILSDTVYHSAQVYIADEP